MSGRVLGGVTVVVLLVLAAAAGLIAWWWTNREGADKEPAPEEASADEVGNEDGFTKGKAGVVKDPHVRAKLGDLEGKPLPSQRTLDLIGQRVGGDDEEEGRTESPPTGPLGDDRTQDFAGESPPTVAGVTVGGV